MTTRVDENGLTLARAYWEQVVRGILDEALPGVPRAAARIGTGSEVLGLDDEMSRDHDWGLRLQLVVPPDRTADVEQLLRHRVPTEFAGYPTRIRFTGRPDAVQAIDVVSLDELVATRLGFDPQRSPTVEDWLSVTGQAALEVTAGEVFEDTDGGLTRLRTSLAWYPDDVWRHVVASGWQRIDQELPLMGRAGDRGDDLGSRVIAARLVDIAMHLGFLLCRRWAPYGKWRGTCFSRLPLPPEVGRGLAAALAADGWGARGEHLAGALDGLAQAQRQAGMPAPARACVPFWERPYLHLDPSLVEGVMAGVRDEQVRRFPLGLGSIEQRSDNVDLLTDVRRRRRAVGAEA